MNKKKYVLVVLVVSLLLILFICYLFKFRLPTYPGRLSIDLCNNTWNTISGVTLTYSDSDKIVELPDIRPQERLIVLAPSDIYDVPTKSTIFLNYNYQQYTLLNEYHSINGGKYNLDVIQCAKVTFKNNRIDIFDTARINFIKQFSIKPYLRIVDLNK